VPYLPEYSCEAPRRLLSVQVRIEGAYFRGQTPGLSQQGCQPLATGPGCVLGLRFQVSEASVKS
jgi:hypothetical protein